jgi:hypothetical protein
LRVKLLGRLVDLEERLLEHVFGRGAIPQEADEEVIQLALVAADKLGKTGLIAGAVVGEELFVAAPASAGERAAAAVTVPVASVIGAAGRGHGDGRAVLASVGPGVGSVAIR